MCFAYCRLFFIFLVFRLFQLHFPRPSSTVEWHAWYTVNDSFTCDFMKCVSPCFDLHSWLDFRDQLTKLLSLVLMTAFCFKLLPPLPSFTPLYTFPWKVPLHSFKVHIELIFFYHYNTLYFISPFTPCPLLRDTHVASNNLTRRQRFSMPYMVCLIFVIIYQAFNSCTSLWWSHQSIKIKAENKK